ncbi:hypothetical protein SEEB0225_22150 [Salmonella enterica subsp. enterica serovar Bareilly str. CFSAN000225]|nr:hypothetical protein SEEB0225_22150 [Salmonella enterica subsp. enterica serovar Bareilly str. CFSAN000225]
MEDKDKWAGIGGGAGPWGEGKKKRPRAGIKKKEGGEKTIRGVGGGLFRGIGFRGGGDPPPPTPPRKKKKNGGLGPASYVKYFKIYLRNIRSKINCRIPVRHCGYSGHLFYPLQMHVVGRF